MPMYRSLLLICVVSFSSGAFAETKLVRHFAPGSKPTEVGMLLPEDKGDVPLTGPQALVALRDGALLLLDQINRRVLKFNPYGSEAPAVIRLPEGLEPTDLAVLGNEMFAWEDGPVQVAQDGRRINKLSVDDIKQPERALILSQFAQAGSRLPADLMATLDLKGDRPPSGRRPQFIASGKFGPVRAVIDERGERNAAVVRLMDPSDKNVMTLDVTVRDRIGSLQLLKLNDDGKAFLLVENVPRTVERKPSVLVARYDSGKLEAAYDVTPEGAQAVPRRYVAVTDKGNVFTLRQMLKGLDVLEVFADRADPATPLGKQASAPKLQKTAAVATAQPLTPRKTSDMLTVAAEFATVRWQVTQTAYGSSALCAGFNPARKRRPWYTEPLAGKDAVGVPYNWGGFQPVSGFLNQIKATAAGNVCTKSNPNQSLYAGVDCSGYVSQVWGLPRHYSTRELHVVAEAVSDRWSLKPGDAFVLAGEHTRLFVNYTGDGRIHVLEAATGGCRGKVCPNDYDFGQLDHYTAYRYQAATN